MNQRIVWIIVLVVLVVVGGIAGLVATMVFALFGMMDRADAHVCGLAYVKASPVAARLVGSPISQKGVTGGSTSTDNGELKERLTFTVTGPLGEAAVVSEGQRSQLDSHLEVRIGRDQQSETVYSGKFDCAELHKKER